jgi:hypothetical protein
MAGRAAEVVQYLPSKCEALSSNPNTKNKKNKKKRKEKVWEEMMKQEQQSGWK